MEFTDRMMAVDRSVAAYRRFTHGELNSIATDLIADLLHWHNRFILDGSLTVDEATNIAMTALEHFEAERAEALTTENPLRGRRAPENPFRSEHRAPQREVPRRIVQEQPDETAWRQLNELITDVRQAARQAAESTELHPVLEVDDPDVTIDF